MEGLDYVYYVSCSVKNYGNAEGTARMSAYLRGNNIGQMEQTQDIFLYPDEERNLRFKFDISFWDGGVGKNGVYDCSVVPIRSAFR